MPKGMERNKQMWVRETSQKCEAMQRLALSSSRKTWLSGAKAGSGSQLENEDTAEMEP